MSNEQVEWLIDQGIRLLHFARDHDAWWCIHCNKFLDWERRYEADEHGSLCPYQALDGLRKENELMRSFMFESGVLGAYSDWKATQGEQ